MIKMEELKVGTEVTFVPLGMNEFETGTIDELHPEDGTVGIEWWRWNFGGALLEHDIVPLDSIAEIN